MSVTFSGGKKTQEFFIRIIYFGIVLNSLHFILAKIIPLQEITPKVNEVAILGHNDSCYIYYSFGLAYALIFGSRLGFHRQLMLWAAIIISYLIHFERAPVLGFLAVATILLFHRNIWYRGIDNRRFIAVGGILLLVAVLGGADFAMPFSALGLDTFPIEQDEEIVESAKKIIEDKYVLVVVAENVAEVAEQVFATHHSKSTPCVVVVPFTTEPQGFATQALGEAFRMATGIDILQNS